VPLTDGGKRSKLKRLDMIKLKTEVNKSAIMKQLRKEATEMYDAAYEGEYAIEQFLYGAERLFNLLRLPRVSKSANAENKIKVDDPNAPWNWKKDNSEP
jgi:hypothetical protein